MKILQEDSEPFVERITELKARRAKVFDQFGPEVDAMLAEYRENKEEALLRFAKDFDQVELDRDSLWVQPDQIKNAHKLISPELKSSIETTLSRIERFQHELKTSSFQTQEDSGVYWGVEQRPYNRVGIYVPRNYFFTLLLCAVPARIAGVEELIISTPPVKALGSPYVDPAILYVAKLLDIDKILLAGGVGAMAAMAYGTESTLPVEKIVGPSRKRGLIAKQRLSYLVGIDGFTGPSEVAFVCDRSSSVKIVASDISSIADHNPDAEIYVFHQDSKWLQQLLDELVRQTTMVKDQGGREGLRVCLESRTSFFETSSIPKAIDVINELSPGFVSIQTKHASEFIPLVRNCGALLLGSFTPPAMIDLIGGAIGLVSTLGASRFFSPTGPATFTRQFRVMEIDRAALERYRHKSLELSKVERFSTRKAVFNSRLGEFSNPKA